MRRLLLATALAAPLFLAAPTGRAQMPVIDFAQLGEWARQLQYTVATGAVPATAGPASDPDRAGPDQHPAEPGGPSRRTSAEHDPKPAAGHQPQPSDSDDRFGPGGLHGRGRHAVGDAGDGPRTAATFLGSLLNGGASRLAGLMACTNQMMQATEQRLTQMPQLLSELQNCSDVTCATTLSGRIQLETATINAQQQQAILMGLAQQQQRWAADDLVLQKMRADLEAVFNSLPSGTDWRSALAATVPAAVASAPVFSASTRASLGIQGARDESAPCHGHARAVRSDRLARSVSATAPTIRVHACRTCWTRPRRLLSSISRIPAITAGR